MHSVSASPTPPSPRIGMFDSGVGGLSVLQAVKRAVPAARLHYVADSAFAPYGERPDDEILDRSQRIVQHLVAQGARLVVVACNTATAVAIDSLRSAFSNLRFVGVEPGVRPALARSRLGRVAVLATEATLRSERFHALVRREAAADQLVHSQACPGLAAAIERGAIDEAELRSLITRFGDAARAAGVDVAALGCTHYSFVRPDLERVLGSGIVVIDTADAVAAQVARLWSPANDASVAPDCLLESTGEPDRLRRFAARWLAIDATVAPTPLSL